MSTAPIETWNDVLSAILNARYSCRAFLSRPVPREAIDQAFALAQRTASWCNMQPWHATVVSGEALEHVRRSLRDAASLDRPSAPDIEFPTSFGDEHLTRRRACGHQLYAALGIARSDMKARRQQLLRNFDLFGAPHAAFVTVDPEIGPYGLVDVGGYIQVLLLTLRAHGIASVAQAAIAHHAELLKPMLRIDPKLHLVCGISFGYEDPANPANGFRTAREGLENVVHYLGA
jgi:nitroreductase